jgi:hypothetical protein
MEMIPNYNKNVDILDIPLKWEWEYLTDIYYGDIGINMQDIWGGYGRLPELREGKTKNKKYKLQSYKDYEGKTKHIITISSQASIGLFEIYDYIFHCLAHISSMNNRTDMYKERNRYWNVCMKRKGYPRYLERYVITDNYLP